MTATKTFILALQVVEEGKVKQGTKEYARAIISVSDQIFKPDWWSVNDAGSVDNPENSVETYYLGDYSEDKSLMFIYLNRPDLVRSNESRLDVVGAPIPEGAPRKTEVDIVEEVAPKAIELEASPMKIYVAKPNFWTIRGDYYLQFLQNYVSDNWYKGGESNYSMLGSVTMQANYNNKQKVKWENKLEMRLGYQTSKGDTLHKYKTSEDLLRYTGKFGLQATKRWYYTLQLIGQTQFTKGLRSNDKFVYSDFMSPFKLNLSVGMDYSIDWCNHRLKGSTHIAPLALNWKYVGRSSLATRYGLEEGQHGLVDYGSEFTVDFTWQIPYLRMNIRNVQIKQVR